MHQQDILDHETGQTGIHIIGESSQSSTGTSISSNTTPVVEEYDEPYPHSAPVHCGSKVVPAEINGGATKACGSQDFSNPPTLTGAGDLRKSCDHHGRHSLSRSTVPPLPPPLPVAPSSSLPTAAVVHPRGGARGVAGTVQFAGFSNNNHCTGGDLEARQKESMTSYASSAPHGNDQSSSANTGTFSKAHPDPPLECPSTEERQQLMDEITTAGQSVLRRTTRPKSPGGTPIKPPQNRLTLTGNTDMLQRALINKFRSLHSTPIGHHSPAVADKSGSFDLSSTWSDINSSCVAYEDPDLSSTPPSMTGRPNRSALTRADTSNRSDIGDPNSSTAV